MARSTIGLFVLLLGLASWAADKGCPAGEAKPVWPFFALCMDTHDARQRSLAEQASMLNELGYDGAGHLWLDNLPERIRTLDESGLTLYQVYMRVDLDKTPHYDQRLAAVLPLLKGRPTMLAVLFYGGKPSDEALDPAAVDILREIADAAARHDVRVVLYPHANAWLERVEDSLRLIEKCDRANLGVMFNLCHWLAVDREENLEPLLERAKPRLWAVSLHGADRAAEVQAKTGQWIQPLDQGNFDIAGLLKILRRLDYRGPIGLQCYGIPGDAREHLQRSMAAWRKLNKEGDGP